MPSRLSFKKGSAQNSKPADANLASASPANPDALLTNPSLRASKEMIYGNLLDSPSQELPSKAPLVMTQRDIIGAYRIFLGREPESLEVIYTRVGKSSERTLVEFLTSTEFIKRPGVAGWIVNAAQQLTQDNKPSLENPQQTVQNPTQNPTSSNTWALKS